MDARTGGGAGTRSGGRARRAGAAARKGNTGCPDAAPPRLAARGPRGRRSRAMIHDVDQLLEKLVRRDALNGSAVDLVFDAPTKDWVARRSGPAVDLYLYDIREDLQRRVPAWEDVRGRGGDGRRPPAAAPAGSGWPTS